MPPVIYGDGLQTRDYTYIEDAIRAYDLVLNHNEPIIEPLNFGTAKEVSIVDLANKIIDFCGEKSNIKPTHVESRIGEVKKLIANANKAKEFLGWEAKYSLEEGLKEFIQWYKKYGMEERIKIE